jgi:hypothetical protein
LMFRVDQEADGLAEDEQWAPQSPRRYYLTQFTSEDCPQSLKDDDSSAPPDPKQEKDLPSKCQWWGTHHVRCARGNVVSTDESL